MNSGLSGVSGDRVPDRRVPGLGRSSRRAGLDSGWERRPDQLLRRQLQGGQSLYHPRRRGDYRGAFLASRSRPAAGRVSHAVELWTPAGALVATSATSAETAGYTGWVEVAFPAPIVTTAGQQWIAVFACSGHAYAATATLVDAARATWSNGRYVANPPGGFPSNTNPPNYFVDLYFGVPVEPTTGASCRSIITSMRRGSP